MGMPKTHLKMPIDNTAPAPAEIGEYWNKGLDGKAGRINDHMLNRVPDGEAYLNTIAERAEQEYQSYPNPGYISKKGLTTSGITSKFAANIKRAYEKFKENWKFMFDNDAANYKERVARGLGRFLKGIGERTLALTGFKKQGRGPAAIAGFWLSGDAKIIRELRSGDTAEGGPFRICPIGTEGDLRAALNQRLVKAGGLVLRSNLDDATIDSVNTAVNQLVQRYVDPSLGLESFTTGGASHVDFIKENKQLYLDIKVSQV
ncbi:MAG: hypothetical protein HY811_00105 [Planctomycetes bacterium]|nr:hypothetical protein [Planctomycetota bacterium]